MKVLIVKGVVAIVILLGASQNVFAGNDQVPMDRLITRIDTYTHSAVLYFTPPFLNTQGCAAVDDKVVIDLSSERNKKLYAQMLANAMTGKEVGFGLKGCGVNLPDYPIVYRADSLF